MEQVAIEQATKQLIDGLKQTLSVNRRFLYLVAKLIVEILVEKDLNDNLVFVTIIPEAKVAAGLFQPINELLGCLFNCDLFHILCSCPHSQLVVTVEIFVCDMISDIFPIVQGGFDT